MSEFRKLLNLIAENSCAGSVASVVMPLGATQKRVKESEEDTVAETTDADSKEFKNSPETKTVAAASDYGSPKAPKTEPTAKDTDGTPSAPPVVEYGNWENSALVTTGKVKAKRKGPAPKDSVYGKKKVSESKKSADAKDFDDFNDDDWEDWDKKVKSVGDKAKKQEAEKKKSTKKEKVSESDLSEESLLAKEKREELFKQSRDRALGKRAADRAIQHKKAVNEGAMDEAHAELQDIVDNEDYDALYALFTANTPAGKFVQNIYDDVAIDTGLHPDDDFERIQEIVFERLADEFGSHEMSEGTEPEQRQMDMNRRAALNREREPRGSEKIDARLAKWNSELSDWYVQKDGRMFKVSVHPSQEAEAESLGYSRTREEAARK